jgi:hypothetical protein
LEPFKASAGSILPCMLVGLVCRGLGIVVGLYVTRRRRAPATADESRCEVVFQANRRSLLFDAGFCFLAMLPRASIQGALAGEPVRRGFFSDAGAQGQMATELIFNGGRVYIFVMAVCGSILLDLLGPRLLQASMARASLPQEVLDEESRMFHEGWKARFRRWRQRTGKKWDDRLTDFERVASIMKPETLLTSQRLGGVDFVDVMFRKAASWSIADAPAKDFHDPLTQGMDVENPTDAGDPVRRCRSGPSSLVSSTTDILASQSESTAEVFVSGMVGMQH